MKSALILIVSIALGSCGSPPAEYAPSFKPIANDMLATVVDPARSRTKIEADMRKACEGKQFCAVFGWTDPIKAASAMPMTDREAAAVAVTLSINRASGLDQILWDCTKFAGLKPDSCLAKF
jgi:hypothetical protein